MLYQQAEKKKKINYVDEVNVNTVSQGQFYDMLYIGQGTDSQTRIGDEIKASGLHIKGVLRNNSTTTTNYVRMVVFWSKDTTNYTSSSDLFQLNAGTSADFTNANVAGLNSIYMPLNKAQITPIYDKVFRLGMTTSDDGGDTIFFNKFLKLHNRRIKYEGSAVGATNLAPRLHLGIWASEAPDDTGAGTNVELSCIHTLYFTDV